MQSQIKHSVVPVPEKHGRVIAYKKILFILCTFVLLSFIWSVSWTFLSLQSIKAKQFSQASSNANMALPVVSFYSAISLHKSPDVELWKNTLQLIPQAVELQTASQSYLKLALQSDTKATTQSGVLLTNLKQFDATLLRLVQNSKTSFLFQSFIKPKLSSALQNQLDHTADLPSRISAFESVFSQLLHGNHRLVVLFQNSEELRATGGFIGSYAIIDLSDGTVAPIQFYDIFDADGQINTEFEAPPGVKEYLSGGKGMRLPNANWNPDFPTSAQDILKFFALAGVQQADGVIAINLSVVEDLLDITGPVLLPDYAVPVTSENVSQLARADRAEYFPGSKQKKNFLKSLSTQLRLSMQDLNSRQQLALGQTLWQEVHQKSVQFFFHSADLEHFVQSVDAAGQLTQYPQFSDNQNRNPLASPFFMELVESNVGINKANRNIQRQVQMNIADKTVLLQITFQNRNLLTPFESAVASPSAQPLRENPRNDYINYQRIFVSPTTLLSKISQDGHLISSWDETIITTATGEKLKQIGFLVTVPEQLQSNVNVELEMDHSFQLRPTIVLPKQSGLPATPYTIQYGKQSKNLVLEQDEVIQFTP